MKKLNLIITFLVVLTFSANSQVITKVTEGSTGATCKVNTDKNKVVFCDIKTDTLSSFQLRDCNTIKVLTDPTMEIISYSLIFRTKNSDIYEFSGSGNLLPEKVIDKILTNDLSFFWLENITVKKGDATLNIGTRKFYLKS
ncbi:MAG TPA: hypothetical protein VK212_03830 [Lentimicrobium sp.]|nr:hypothetical protein [Lentimicrobium sp.]